MEVAIYQLVTQRIGIKSKTNVSVTVISMEKT